MYVTTFWKGALSDRNWQRKSKYNWLAWHHSPINCLKGCTISVLCNSILYRCLSKVQVYIVHTGYSALKAIVHVKLLSLYRPHNAVRESDDQTSDECVSQVGDGQISHASILWLSQVQLSQTNQLMIFTEATLQSNSSSVSNLGHTYLASRLQQGIVKSSLLCT